MENVINNFMWPLIVGLVVLIPGCWFSFQLKYSKSKEELINKLKKIGFRIYYWVVLISAFGLLIMEVISTEPLPRVSILNMILYSSVIIMIAVLKIVVNIWETLSLVRQENMDTAKLLGKHDTEGLEVTHKRIDFLQEKIEILERILNDNKNH